MYLPGHFKEEHQDKLTAFIRQHSFGVLVSTHEQRPFVSHLPFLYEPGMGGHGKLLGHMARANPQWQSLADGQETLTVFQGPHAYISPSWYDAPGVPTWNYAVVHVHGTAKLIEDVSSLWRLVQRMTEHYEAAFERPWQPKLSETERERLLGMIVGFEVAITDIQGKFKLSQNRSPELRGNVIRHLRAGGSPDGAAVAALMEQVQVR